MDRPLIHVLFLFRAQILSLAAAVESATRHPLADAVLAAAAARGLTPPAVEAASTTPGAGVAATVAGRQVAVGRPEWVLRQMGVAPVEADSQAAAARAAAAGTVNGADGASSSGAVVSSTAQTVVYVGAGGKLLGCLSFSDVLRPDAVSTIAKLREAGKRLLIFSGDDGATVAAVAAQLGIEPAAARGNLTPQVSCLVLGAYR